MARDGVEWIPKSMAKCYTGRRVTVRGNLGELKN